MANITFDNDGFTVNLTPAEKFFAMHGSLQVPFSHVVDASVQNRSGWSDMWRKVIGTNAPA